MCLFFIHVLDCCVLDETPTLLLSLTASTTTTVATGSETVSLSSSSADMLDIGHVVMVQVWETNAGTSLTKRVRETCNILTHVS